MIDLWPIAVIGLLYLWRVDFQSYSVFTVGTFKKVYRYESTDQTAECSAKHCESGCLEGVIRKATKEVVIFGCPIIRQTTAVNRYCPDHTSFEFQQGEYGVTTTERVKQAAIPALVSIFSTRVGEVGETENSQFENLSNTTSSAFGLAPVVLLILITVILVHFAKAVRGEI